MKGLISIAQMRKKLREHGHKVPSSEAIWHVLDKYGYKQKAYPKYYYSASAFGCLSQHLVEALEYDIAKKTPIRQNPNKESTPSPRCHVRDGANNMQAYSQHLINADNYGYDEDDRTDESVQYKSIIITEEQYRRIFSC